MMANSQLTRFGLFDARVPRYTSYPTAPHFGQQITQGHFADWVRAIPEGAEISLYIHIPFCRRLCWFCACRTQGTQSDDPVLAYLATLQQEIALLGELLPKGVRLARLHWGGGTPTILPAPAITQLAQAIAKIAPLSEAAEFSVEIDPNEVDGPRLDALAAAGMNRASIGVQDFDPEIQKTIGREQGFALTQEIAAELRARNIHSLNADILYGLPHQTPEKITDSVKKLIALDPDRVALYGYAHVPWMSRRQQMIPSDAIPTPQERLRLFETARALFLAAGYQEIGIDHFAKPEDSMALAQKGGHLRRNFQGYTDDVAPVLIGLGASSISRFPQGYAQNASATAAYTAAIRQGDFATAKGHIFDEDDLLRGRIIEALMCDFRVDRNELLKRFQTTPEALALMFSEALESFGGMLEYQNGILSIPPHARPLTRMIARTFDSYDQSKAQHSAAV